MKFTELKSIKIPRRLLIQEVSNIAMLVRHHEHINIVTGYQSISLEVSKTEAIQDAYLADLGLILERIRKTSPRMKCVFCRTKYISLYATYF